MNPLPPNPGRLTTVRLPTPPVITFVRRLRFVVRLLMIALQHGLGARRLHLAISILIVGKSRAPAQRPAGIWTAAIHRRFGCFFPASRKGKIQSGDESPHSKTDSPARALRRVLADVHRL